MDLQKNKDSIKIAKLYYQEGMSQEAIAKKMDISRPTVSRLLNHAKDHGFVTVKIDDPYEDAESLASLIKSKYNLKDCIVQHASYNDYLNIQSAIGKRTAEYLTQIVKSGDKIGISWGKTMYQVSQYLEQSHLKDIGIIQLKGGISFSHVDTRSHQILERFAQAYNATPRDLPLPVIFDVKEVKDMVEKDRHIKSILEQGRQVDIAIFTVGTVRDSSLLFKLGFLNEEEKTRLKKSAVGDICSRFYNNTGEVADEAINNRTIGIGLDALKEIENTVLVAGGEHKIESIRGALEGQLSNILITDQYTAQALID
ncbi:MULTISPECIES: sugar-binding transcriptional regulator [Mammaliicoccus]|uniref:Sugar-binding transcriptional regulator n=2 Tax=Mammaliicoccus TaxID=2803850 RepID=A0ABS5MMP0_9STAP|nr:MULTISPECIES: sugar-binding transcriptional regulator [Mammaliicoccus]HCN59900.1 sugar-binding transcriptional regulator [Staphylococcus sp.]MBL0846733.1 sugar-binding transcriptional regulator [Mammaliicoccus fleurettii]MBO3061874.1 sugar-binding transcriptional regulator [Mammaliicoccus fleurettii]MBS3672289.1 sugar-binding transcriptional regulator [Mammaliicoccus fleurettii]MBS3697195.1 sugar-binding transcriptional regulator [Mammaliicoccus fleurettii]